MSELQNQMNVLAIYGFAKIENQKLETGGRPTVAGARSKGDPTLAYPFVEDEATGKLILWMVSLDDPLKGQVGGRLMEFIVGNVSDRFPSVRNSAGWAIIERTYRPATRDEVLKHLADQERHKAEIQEAEAARQKTRVLKVAPATPGDMAGTESIEALRERLAILEKIAKLESAKAGK